MPAMRSAVRRLVWRLLLPAVLSAVLLAGCRRGTDVADEDDAGPALFEDVTEQRGLRFRHDEEAATDFRMPRVMGPGGAFLDFDNDGRLDVLLVHNGGP